MCIGVQKLDIIVRQAHADFHTLMLPLVIPRDHVANEQRKNRDAEAFGLIDNNGGDDGNRTHDIYLAKVALCQLSYVPP